MERSKSVKSKKRKRHHSHHSSSDEDSDDSYRTSSTKDSTSESGSESSDSESPEEKERPRSKKARRSSKSECHGGRKHKKRKERESLKHKERRKSKESTTKRKKERRHSESKTKVEKKSKREKISMDDYFIKSAEFRIWLSNERGKFFNDLTSEESRKLFKKFADKWNSGLLKKKYYRGIQTASVGHDSQSKYKWKFASGIDSSELKTMRESVSSWTASTTKDEDDKHTGESSSRGAAGGASSQHLIGPQLPGQSQPSPTTRGGMIGPSIGPRMGPFQGLSRNENTFESEERREIGRVILKKERKDLRKHQEMVLDELLPKATGREARIEKKRAKNEQRRAREASPDVADSTLMGSRADIKDKLRFRQERRQNRAQAAVQKISDYEAKEKARVAAILEMAKANKKEGAMW